MSISPASMNYSRLTLLNASVLTAFGDFRFEPLSLEEARTLVREYQAADKPIDSAIGHEPTSDLLTTVLEFPAPKNRVEFKQTTQDAALVLKLRKRPPEGKILSRQEMESIGYEFGLLTRLA